MRKTMNEHKCDRCGYTEIHIDGKAPENSRVFTDVSVKFSSGGHWIDNSKRNAYWCIQCLRDTRLVIGKVKETEPSAEVKAPEPPTLEDMIRMIVREEIHRTGA